MKTGCSILSSVLLISSLCAPAMAQQSAEAPPLVKEINNGNWLPQKEAEDLRDELYYQRHSRLHDHAARAGASAATHRRAARGQAAQVFNRHRLAAPPEP
jgi:hypothetical protein